MNKNKLLFRIFIIMGFVLVNALILFGISQVIAYLNTGADRSKMLHLDTPLQQSYIPEIQWRSTDNPGRPMETANLNKIERDYLNAWNAKNQAFYTGEQRRLYDHYTSKARTRLESQIEWNKKAEVYIESITTAHHLSLEFYSADGTLVVLSDKNVSSTHRTFKNDRLIEEQDFISDFHIIMLLEDGFWKIRHLEKTATHPVSSPKTISFPDISTINGVNYYPQHAPWDTFGESFSKDTLARDFARVKDLRLNTLRIFVGYEDFGKATVSEQKVKRLISLLDQAQHYDLKIIITLFDFYGDYRMQDWNHTNAHLRAIVSSTKDHPALLAWDIKNEPDLDFDTRKKQLVNSWLRQSIRYLKTIDSNHPVTIGWSSPETALALEDYVDVVSYHYYQDISDLTRVHQSLRKASSKPVILQEFGLSTYRGLWNPFGYDNSDQTKYYKTFLEQQKRDSFHYLFWTLYDFNQIPQNVSGDLPWRKNKQAYFGIINQRGVKDEAYTVFKNRQD